jgi:hypothetical protein
MLTLFCTFTLLPNFTWADHHVLSDVAASPMDASGHDVAEVPDPACPSPMVQPSSMTAVGCAV